MSQTLVDSDPAVTCQGLFQQMTWVVTWRRKYRSGGAGALSTLGRPSNLSRLTEAPSAQPSSEGIEAKQRRIEELERKIGQQPLEINFLKRCLQRIEEQRMLQALTGKPQSTSRYAKK